MSDLATLVDAVAVDPPLVDHPADYHVFHKFIARCENLPYHYFCCLAPSLTSPCGAQWKPPPIT